MLTRALQRRGYDVTLAASCEQARRRMVESPPAYAVVDLRVGHESGLSLIPLLARAQNPARTVVLTGYGSIATAVEAIKLGAGHYLAKPSNTDDIEAAFGLAEGNTEVELTNRSSSIKTLEWERIHEVLAESDFNISEAARRLGMHRRTLSRKLGKQRV